MGLDPLTSTAIAIGGGALLGGLTGGDDEPATQTQTTNNIPEYAKKDIQTLWNDFMDRLYPKTTYSYSTTANAGDSTIRDSLYNEWKNIKNGAAGTPISIDLISKLYGGASQNLRDFMNKSKISFWSDDAAMQKALNDDLATYTTTETAYTPKSYEDMLAEDLDAQRTATGVYNTGLTNLNQDTMTRTQGATQGYTDLLNQYVQQGNAGEGLFKPTNISFGGKQIASFVPKSNRNLAAQLSGFGKESMDTNLALLNLENQYGADALKRILQADTTYTPNAAKTAYIEKTLLPLATSLITGKGSTTTATSDEGGSVWEDLLSGALAGTYMYSNIMRK